jgi:hypothetical protein
VALRFFGEIQIEERNFLVAINLISTDGAQEMQKSSSSDVSWIHID